MKQRQNSVPFETFIFYLIHCLTKFRMDPRIYSNWSKYDIRLSITKELFDSYLELVQEEGILILDQGYLFLRIENEEGVINESISVMKIGYKQTFLPFWKKYTQANAPNHWRDAWIDYASNNNIPHDYDNYVDKWWEKSQQNQEEGGQTMSNHPLKDSRKMVNIVHLYANHGLVDSDVPELFDGYYNRALALGKEAISARDIGEKERSKASHRQCIDKANEILTHFESIKGLLFNRCKKVLLARNIAFLEAIIEGTIYTFNVDNGEILHVEETEKEGVKILDSEGEEHEYPSDRFSEDPPVLVPISRTDFINVDEKDLKEFRLSCERKTPFSDDMDYSQYIADEENPSHEAPKKKAEKETKPGETNTRPLLKSASVDIRPKKRLSWVMVIAITVLFCVAIYFAWPFVQGFINNGGPLNGPDLSGASNPDSSGESLIVATADLESIKNQLETLNNRVNELEETLKVSTSSLPDTIDLTKRVMDLEVANVTLNRELMSLQEKISERTNTPPIDTMIVISIADRVAKRSLKDWLKVELEAVLAARSPAMSDTNFVRPSTLVDYAKHKDLPDSAWVAGIASSTFITLSGVENDTAAAQMITKPFLIEWVATNPTPPDSTGTFTITWTALNPDDPEEEKPYDITWTPSNPAPLDSTGSYVINWVASNPEPPTDRRQYKIAWIPENTTPPETVRLYTIEWRASNPEPPESTRHVEPGHETETPDPTPTPYPSERAWNQTSATGTCVVDEQLLTADMPNGATVQGAQLVGGILTAYVKAERRSDVTPFVRLYIKDTPVDNPHGMRLLDVGYHPNYLDHPTILIVVEGSDSDLIWSEINKIKLQVVEP